MASLHDHFSTHSTSYASARPRDPDELFHWLATQAPARERALDVATGNGQAAIGLAAFFAEVAVLIGMLYILWTRDGPPSEGPSPGLSLLADPPAQLPHVGSFAATNGANLIEGLKHLEEDLQTPDGRLRIKQTDQTAFEVGKNIGVAVAATDFTGDGKPDILTGSRNGTPWHRVFQNNQPGPASLLPGFDVIANGFNGSLYVAV